MPRGPRGPRDGLDDGERAPGGRRRERLGVEEGHEGAPLRPIYLDNHATTRCDPRVVDAMVPYFTEEYGNASSRSHRYGLAAREAVEQARAQVAARIGASAKEVVFTSGATESDNLAVLGAARIRRVEEGKKHVVTVVTEHKAVLDAVQALAREGFDVTVLPVDPAGLVDPAAVRAAVRADTAVVSVMLVNNEIGVVQPVAEVAAAAHAAGAWVHCDGAQAVHVPVDVQALGVDLLSVSGHKMYGPKGVGALYVRRGRPRVRLEPLQFGGGHERGWRSGTLPVPLCVGLGAASALLQAEAGEPDRLRALRDRLWASIRAGIDGVELNGDAVRRAPNNLNLSVEGIEAEALLMALRDEVALSTGSACSSETLSPSHVLQALGMPRDRAHASVRFGLGRFTTAEETERVASAVIAATVKLRAMRTLYEPSTR